MSRLGRPPGRSIPIAKIRTVIEERRAIGLPVTKADVAADLDTSPKTISRVLADGGCCWHEMLATSWAPSRRGITDDPTMPRLVIAIPDNAETRLRELARAEMRPVRDQAARLILEGLERASKRRPLGVGQETSG